MHQSANAVDIAPVKDATVNDVPTAFVICTDSSEHIPMEIVLEGTKIEGTHLDVILKFVRIEVPMEHAIQPLCCIGHDLHRTDTAVSGDHVLLPTALLPCDSKQQVIW